MFEEINEIKGEIARLQHQKSELQRDVQRISDKLNRKDQELVNYLKQELNGKCEKCVRKSRLIHVNHWFGMDMSIMFSI